MSNRFYLLLSEGRFTDYSGRSFNCTAFEYAYWAKDTYMCRMLLKHMDEHTLAELFQRIETLERKGLAYKLNNKIPQDSRDIERAWHNIGKQQRLVPVHVANEYCHPDRSFDPTPNFNEETLPRSLCIYNWIIDHDASWFPVAVVPNSGLGFNFAVYRGNNLEQPPGGLRGTDNGNWRGRVALDFAAIKRLVEVRTIELTSLFDQLKKARLHPGLSL